MKCAGIDAGITPGTLAEPLGICWWLCCCCQGPVAFGEGGLL
jgi:hypothetical protein